MAEFEDTPKQEESPEIPNKKDIETEDQGGEKLTPNGKTSEQDDQLRFQKHEFILNNQQIIEFAYLTKKVIEVCIEGHSKLFIEQACYVHCFNTVRKMLEAVELEYAEKHGNLMSFFRKGRELSTDYDTLHFISPGEEDTKVIDTLSESDLQENIKLIREGMGTQFFRRNRF